MRHTALIIIIIIALLKKKTELFCVTQRKLSGIQKKETRLNSVKV